jgi:hypothetical protein
MDLRWKNLCPILNTYVGMLSPASGPAVLRQGNDMVNLDLVSLESSLDGLASSHVLRLTLLSMPKIPLYCMEYNWPTTLTPTNEESAWAQ